MMEAKRMLAYTIATIICILLQEFLSPIMTIGFAMPNFILCFVAVTSLLRTGPRFFIVPFVAGLFYDFMGSGPVGAMALTCIVIACLCGLAFRTLNNDSLFMPMGILVIACFLGEIMYGLLCIACGQDVSFLEALTGRMLTCGLYDTVICLVAFPISYILTNRTRSQAEVSIINQ